MTTQESKAVTLVGHEIGTPGGMERQLGELASGLLERGYHLTVVARACELPPHPALRWVRIRGPRRPFSLWYPWFFVLGSLAVRRHGRGLVHTTGALIFNRADVSTVHFLFHGFRSQTRGLQASKGSALYRLNGWVTGSLASLAERLCYRPSRSRRLVAVSRGVAGELCEFFPQRVDDVEVIPNGVDREAFAPDSEARTRLRSGWGVPDHELVALFVGGDWERKGLSHAIEALPRVAAWRLVVVGFGDDGAYRAHARRLGVEERVRFLGPVTDPAPHYAASDAFLLPTSYETFSLVTYEAAAAGLPLLVGRVSGVEDLLTEGRNGWFVERDGDRIAARLGELGDDPGLRRAMGAAARADSAAFDWSEVVGSYDRLYRRLWDETRSTMP